MTRRKLVYPKQSEFFVAVKLTEILIKLKRATDYNEKLLVIN